MLKNALKIFFKSMIYLFLTMGIVYLFIIIMIYLLAAAVISDTGTLVNDSFALITEASENSQAALTDFLTYAVAQVDMSGNIFDVLKRIIDTNWIQNTVKGFFETLNLSTEGFSQSLAELANNYIDKLKLDIVVAALIFVLGVVCANYATRFAVRRKNAKRSLKKFFIATFLEPVLTSAILLLALYVFAVLQAYAILVYIGMAALIGVLALASSWLIHKDEAMKFQDVVNIKNVLLYLAAILIILFINIVFAWLLCFISVPLAVIIIIPCFIYSLNIAGVICDSFVLEKTKENACGEEA